MILPNLSQRGLRVADAANTRRIATIDESEASVYLFGFSLLMHDWTNASMLSSAELQQEIGTHRTIANFLHV